MDTMDAIRFQEDARELWRIVFEHESADTSWGRGFYMGLLYAFMQASRFPELKQLAKITFFKV
jgi:hypothetical protein